MLDFKAKIHQIRFRCLGLDLLPLLFKLHEIWSVDSRENR